MLIVIGEGRSVKQIYCNISMEIRYLPTAEVAEIDVIPSLPSTALLSIEITEVFAIFGDRMRRLLALGNVGEEGGSDSSNVLSANGIVDFRTQDISFDYTIH